MRASLIASLLLLPCIMPAEEIAIHRCDDAPTQKKRKPTDPTLSYQLEERIGIIETGATSLAKIYKAAVEYDRSGDPFYGPGYYYAVIAPDKTRYIIWFEYAPGEKAPPGFRFAIGKLSLENKKKDWWEGNVHEGSCFEKSILEKLKILTDEQLKKDKE